MWLKTSLKGFARNGFITEKTGRTIVCLKLVPRPETYCAVNIYFISNLDRLIRLQKRIVVVQYNGDIVFPLCLSKIAIDLFNQ